MTHVCNYTNKLLEQYQIWIERKPKEPAALLIAFPGNVLSFMSV